MSLQSQFDNAIRQTSYFKATPILLKAALTIKMWCQNVKWLKFINEIATVLKFIDKINYSSSNNNCPLTVTTHSKSISSVHIEFILHRFLKWCIWSKWRVLLTLSFKMLNLIQEVLKKISNTFLQSTPTSNSRGKTVISLQLPSVKLPCILLYLCLCWLNIQSCKILA